MGSQSINKQDLISGLRDLGVASGIRLMVHSSLSSFGRVEGAAQTVVDALMETVTPEGTLMMPSFNHEAPFRRGGPGYYHPGETPTINGAIPDCFWRLDGVNRSLDPTHPIAAWGKDARRYTEFHHRTLTMGPQSPLGMLGAEGGFGLLLGVGYEVNTYHHVVEMTTGAHCLGQRTEAYPVHLPDGRRVMGRTWGWRAGTCPLTDRVAYAPSMRALQRETRIGNSRVVLFRLEDCFGVIARLLREGEDGFPPCSRCPIQTRRHPRTVETDWDAQNGCLKADSEAWGY